MPSGPLLLFDATLHGLLTCSVPAFDGPLAGVLLSASYVPDMAVHSQYGDVTAYELSNADYAPAALTGQSLAFSEGQIKFSSDTVQFGDPVKLGPAKYLALVFGHATALQASNLLLGVADLATSGGAVEAQNSGFSISPPATGWFSIQQSA